MLIKTSGLDPSEERGFTLPVVLSEQVRILNGDPDHPHISPSYVERRYLTMRVGMRRFTSLTNGFSKKVENHARWSACISCTATSGGPTRHSASSLPGDGGRCKRSRPDLRRHRGAVGGLIVNDEPYGCHVSPSEGRIGFRSHPRSSR